MEFPAGVEVVGSHSPEFETVLTPEALQFVAELERSFRNRRLALLQKREERQAVIDAGEMPDFLPETAEIRESDWQVHSIPADLQKRWVEITGPTERKMMINALNSGADVFMADFEDANSPTWENMVLGQVNLADAARRTISFSNPDGKEYKLNDTTATLLVRPRGWHLDEKHVLVDGQAVSGSLFDFGLYFFHNAQELLNRGTGPYFYLPKLENHQEARLWNDVFVMAQENVGVSQGTIKATVLIENVLAAFEMEEILYELREHIAGLNAGRWDYIFSIIKKFRNQPGFLLPNRAQITMTVPFMRAYTDLLVQTCHRRGAHAIGGMAAYIPRREQEANRVAFEQVTADKVRESNDGFDGTWIAHPGLVPVARQVFERVLGERAHQKDRMREDVQARASDLATFKIQGGTITEDGLRLNINVAILYLESWLRGVGAAAIYNLMEDAATAEISRAQVWQWMNSPEAQLEEGRPVTLDLVRSMIPEEMKRIRQMVGDERFENGTFDRACEIFDRLISSERFVDFLTLVAYDYLE